VKFSRENLVNENILHLLCNISPYLENKIYTRIKRLYFENIRVPTTYADKTFPGETTLGYRVDPEYTLANNVIRNIFSKTVFLQNTIYDNFQMVHLTFVVFTRLQTRYKYIQNIKYSLWIVIRVCE